MITKQDKRALNFSALVFKSSTSIDPFWHTFFKFTKISLIIFQWFLKTRQRCVSVSNQRQVSPVSRNGRPPCEWSPSCPEAYPRSSGRSCGCNWPTGFWLQSASTGRVWKGIASASGRILPTLSWGCRLLRICTGQDAACSAEWMDKRISRC